MTVTILAAAEDWDLASAPTTNLALVAWVRQVARLTQPGRIVWCDGSQEEWDRLTSDMVAAGTLTPLNPVTRPGSFLARSAPSDVARVENRTFIASRRREDAGPTNRWREPTALREELEEAFQDSMRGRVMYVVPFAMGPLDGPFVQYGVELTDSPYVVASMRIMTRMGSEILARITRTRPSCLRCTASATRSSTTERLRGGRTLAVQPAEVHRPLPGDPRDLVVRLRLRRQCAAGQEVHGPAHRLGRCPRRGLARRAHAAGTGDVAGRPPLPRRRSLPLRLRQDQLRDAPADPARLAGGDHRRRHRLDAARARRTAVVRSIPRPASSASRPGTGVATNANAVATIASNTIFTNVALTEDGDVWWEGLTDDSAGAPHRLAGQALDARLHRAGRPPQRALHRVGRAVPHHRRRLGRPGRRPDRRHHLRRPPRVERAAGAQARDWDHGVFLGATIASEQTAAAEGPVGQLRRDPFAMLPFAGYNMADYWAHWLEVGHRAAPSRRRPQIFQVNWFRRGEDGRFLWPGFGENSRVLKWICERLDGSAEAVDTPLAPCRPPVPST